jgi:hypothetical protein
MALIEYDGSGGKPVPYFGTVGQALSALQSAAGVAAVSSAQSGSQSAVQKTARALTAHTQLRARPMVWRRFCWD